jgi:hypothetical protein
MLSVKELVASSIYGSGLFEVQSYMNRHTERRALAVHIPQLHPQVTSKHISSGKQYHIVAYIIYINHRRPSSIIKNKLIYNLPPRFRFIETEIKFPQSFTRSTHSHRIPPSSRNRDSRRPITCATR